LRFCESYAHACTFRFMSCGRAWRKKYERNFGQEEA